MNELIFLCHIILLLLFLRFFRKWGEGGLYVYIGSLAVFANVFIIKQITLFGFNVTCSDVYTVGMIFGLNLLQEFYGKKAAKKAANISFILLLFFLVLTQLNLLYIPSKFDTAHSSFNTIFKFTPRIIISSIFVFFLMQRFDIFLYGILKKKAAKRFFFLRNISVAIVSQFLDTALFSFLALYGIVANIYHILLVSFIVKMVTISAFSIYLFIEKKNILKNNKNIKIKIKMVEDDPV